MAFKRSHYENAFEAYLAGRGIPFVSVEDARHYAPAGTGLKLFDYIVYPSGNDACLVDVKGRKSFAAGKTGEPREKSWVTRSDIEGLSGWGEILGADYQPAFVFAYWLSDVDTSASDTVADYAYAGRAYSFWLVQLAKYCQHYQPLSLRWDTVTVPRKAFWDISVGLDGEWIAAPC